MNRRPVLAAVECVGAVVDECELSDTDNIYVTEGLKMYRLASTATQYVCGDHVDGMHIYNCYVI